MLAAVKTPLIEFSFKGSKAALIAIVEKLKESYPIKLVNSSKAKVPWASSDLRKQIKARMNGGAYIRIDLFNAGMTQKALAELTHIPQPHISQMISGKRPVNLENAKRLGKALSRDAKRYRTEISV